QRDRSCPRIVGRRGGPAGRVSFRFPVERIVHHRQPAGRSLQPQLMHAWRIRYTDPDTLAPVTIQAPLPAFWPAEVRGIPLPARSDASA
ncbi:MAG: hypothetical protein ACK48M_02475, partial [Planctomycetia bacterium]